MKISIITVCYNSAATLEQTIESVISQTHPDTEYIIIDGASKDNTAEIVSKYRDRISHFVSEPDKGIYDAMNKGLALATGEVIGILNSDDLYHDNGVLAWVADAFDSDTDCLCTDIEIFDGSPDKVIRYYSCLKWKPWMFRIGHQPPHPGFFARKKCYDAAGNFDTQFRIAADFDMMLRLISVHAFKTKRTGRVTVSMRSGGESQRGFSAIAKANREDHRSLRKNGFFSWYPLIWLKYFIKIFQFLK
ncbi:MAG: glycosyltransferase [Bacteroidetes bacterium]|nr:glycosyltransferase [Bacteroidota bacterium]